MAGPIASLAFGYKSKMAAARIWEVECLIFSCVGSMDLQEMENL